MFTSYSYMGEEIPDIIKWAEERNEPIYKIMFQRQIPNIITGKMITETKVSIMPKCFFDTMRITDGWTPITITLQDIELK